MPVLQPFRDETVKDDAKLRLQLNDLVRQSNAMAAQLISIQSVLDASGATSTLAAAVPVNVNKSQALTGSPGVLAKADHKHNVDTASAVELTDATNSEGTGSSLARATHTHAHGNRSGGSLHSLASAVAHGFMASSDYSALAALQVLVTKYTKATSGSTAGVIKLDSLNVSTSETFHLTLTAIKSGTTTAAYWFGAAGFVCSSGGTTTQVGTTTVSGSSLPAGWTVTVSVASGNPSVTVQAGAADGTVNWTVVAVRAIAP